MWYFGLLAVFGALGVAGWLLRARSPRLGTALLGGAVAGFVAAVGWQVVRSTAGGTPRPVDRHSAALAYFIAYAAAPDVAARPGPVAILLPEETRGNRTTLDSLFDTVARVLSPLPGVEIKEAPVVARPVEVDRGALPMPAFTQALRGVPDAVVWISFVGIPPDFASAPPSALPPRGYVYDPAGGTAWLEPLKSGRLQRVVVPRPPTDEHEVRPNAGPPDELFRAHFLMATPQNADQVAALLGQSRPPDRR